MYKCIGLTYVQHAANIYSRTIYTKFLNTFSLYVIRLHTGTLCKYMYM